MRMRRGRHYTERERMLEQFEVGDYVVPTFMIIGDGIRGIVRGVDPKTQKVMVAWNGSSLRQHTAEEIMLSTAPVENVGGKQLQKLQDISEEILTSSDPVPKDNFKELTSSDMNKIASRIVKRMK